MDLKVIWDEFIDYLNGDLAIEEANVKWIAGIPFLYIRSELDKREVEHAIKKWSARSMRGKRLHSETIFFREDSSQYVYRHRFYVPQEKMFCCGNLCVDCVRLKQ
ncbi:hypothetical protein LCM10_00240 [Rossellomorea aquimaris]|uniref:hypothetical protein n=1 Tax=Rossellomorea aquimaris TaxID=189382 RepID=UPI001CD2C02F|nr:hypothetical protein [Rossellomorea aquimaris]MCA1053393.1 hypothetical protein [Rossellomorea aquimaris]